MSARRPSPRVPRLDATAPAARGPDAFSRGVRPLYGLLSGGQGTWSDLRARDSLTATLHVLEGGVEVRLRLRRSGAYSVWVRRLPGTAPVLVARGMVFPGPEAGAGVSRAPPGAAGEAGRPRSASPGRARW